MHFEMVGSAGANCCEGLGDPSRVLAPQHPEG